MKSMARLCELVSCSSVTYRQLCLMKTFIIGPSEITVFLPEAIAAVNGPGSNCIKSAWYDNTLPTRGLINLRDKAEHDMRRNIWNQAFTPKGSAAILFPYRHCVTS